MNVVNVHERSLGAPTDAVGTLLDSLASGDDRLWPAETWPRMRFDRPLGAGAVGGHGPIRYVVEEYVPGRSIRFRFVAPAGFDGGHRFEVVPHDDGTSALRHVLEMRVRGRARITWPLVFRPLHDALLEDALSRAETSLGLPVHVRRWSRRVRLLRAVLSRRRGPRGSVR